MTLLSQLSNPFRPDATPPQARLSDGMFLLSQNPIASNDEDDERTERARDTVINQGKIDEKVRRRYAKPHHNAVEVPHFMPAQGTANIRDLRSILYTRERLEELGCRFATNGELVTYGATNSLQEFDQMLRLGPIYDEQWQVFFNAPIAAPSHEHAALWSDLRTLKRVLKNEGVEFGWEHRRITHGDFSYRMMRLCNAYDDLRKIWSATAELRPRASSSVYEQEEDDTSDAHNDSGFVDDIDPGSDARGTVDMYSAFYAAHLPEQARNNVPRNIGWRFSDDIDEVAVDRYRDSINDGTFEQLEEALKIAMAVPLPVIGDQVDRPASPGQPIEAHGLTPKASMATLRAATPNLRYGPSPLQNVMTPSMLIHDEIVANPRSDNSSSLGLDPALVSALASNRTEEHSSEEEPKRKKSLKGWLRGVFGGKQRLEEDAEENKGTNDVRKTMGIGASTYAWF